MNEVLRGQDGGLALIRNYGRGWFLLLKDSQMVVKLEDMAQAHEMLANCNQKNYGQVKFDYGWGLSPPMSLSSFDRGWIAQMMGQPGGELIAEFLERDENEA